MTAETSGRLILGLIDRGRVMDLSLNYLPRLPRRKDFRIGCIGAGFIMRDCHLVAYRHAGFNPVAIASRNPEHARAVAEQHQIAVCHPTYAELLADKNIEVLDIAVPPDVQPGIIREAVKQAVNNAEFKTAMEKLETPIAYLDAPEFQKFWDKDAKMLADAIKRVGKVEIPEAK